MSPTQFPEGYRMVVEAAERFGVERYRAAMAEVVDGMLADA